MTVSRHVVPASMLIGPPGLSRRRKHDSFSQLSDMAFACSLEDAPQIAGGQGLGAESKRSETRVQGVDDAPFHSQDQ